MRTHCCLAAQSCNQDAVGSFFGAFALTSRIQQNFYCDSTARSGHVAQREICMQCGIKRSEQTHSSEPVLGVFCWLQMYDQVCSAEIALLNTGMVGLEFTALGMDPGMGAKPPPGVPVMVPHTVSGADTREVHATEGCLCQCHDSGVFRNPVMRCTRWVHLESN